MSLNFNIPEDNLVRTPGRFEPDPLRAEGHMDYREFIALIKNLWEEIHPDIPVLPVQGKTYTKYPVIVYSLENRKTHNPDPKSRYREQVRTDSNENAIVHGQRFQNYIAFSAVTENEPELCEAIIESFEDFMEEYTPVFKRLGLSDIFYSRRLSDREETRTAGDACIRTVVYMCIIEKVKHIKVSKIEEIVTNVSVRVKPLGRDNGWVPSFNGVDDGPDEFDGINFVETNQVIYLDAQKVSVGDLVRVYRPYTDEASLRYDYPHWTPASGEFNNPTLPGGLKHGETYIVNAVQDNVLTLAFEDKDNIVNIMSPGWLKILPAPKGTYVTDIDDYHATRDAS